MGLPFLQWRFEKWRDLVVLPLSWGAKNFSFPANASLENADSISSETMLPGTAAPWRAWCSRVLMQIEAAQSRKVIQ
jgi:hypothetical protein